MKSDLSRKCGLISILTVLIVLTAGVIGVSAQNPQKGDFVEVQIPDYDVILNGQMYDSQNSQYPILWYGGDTYIPLTWENMRYMGLKLRTFEGGVSICSAPIVNDRIKTYSFPETDNSGELYAQKPEGDYYFNLNQDESGLLLFRDIYYIATGNGNIIDAFGWDKMHDGRLTVDSRNAVRPQNMDDSCIDCDIYRHGCKKYYLWKDGYIEYPSARQDDENFGEFVWRIRGEKEKRCDFTSSLVNVKYLDTVYGNGEMVSAPIKPGVHNGIFVILGAVYIPPTPRIGYTTNVIIGIDLKESKVLMCSEYERRN